MRSGPALAATLLSLASLGGVAEAQLVSRFGADILHQRQPGDTHDLTRGEAVAGLREALSDASRAAIQRLGVTNGFLDDPEIRIGLPGALGEAHARLKPFGMAGPLEELEIAVNRAAEATIGRSTPILEDQINRLAVDDALALLRGGDATVTDTLRIRAGGMIEEALQPLMREALEQAGAWPALDASAQRYAPAMLRTDIHATLLQHATAGALDGLFYYVAQEERAIRRDPARWSSDSLRRVFGG